MLGAMQDWVYDRKPTQSLHFEGPLQELKDDLASGKKVRWCTPCLCYCWISGALEWSFKWF